ncbi:Calcium-transporting ATPase [Heracleum sosnowskyi]|uniref:Calcium-transporting ATPase n=1 Tax=Heracleum sosnowskyi TaxID=360622 RepID=A0AAD8IT82_9APIA|nr:Calcium-transporting ATPase [Heracleum sosnowskyi]
MSNITDQSFSCLESLRKLTCNISRRWRLDFATISSSRAFSFLNGSPKPQNNTENNRLSFTQLVTDKDLQYLEKLGGIEGVVSALETHVEHGILEDHHDGISRRKETFGMNTYPRPPAKTFVSSLMEALKHSIVVVDILGVVLSLVLALKNMDLKKDATCNYRQSIQLDKLSQVSNNIQVKVVRNRRHQQISIFDVVVGDIVCLNIGDQVPADGLFLAGHSLLVDESSLTGKSYLVEISHDENPFLFSGTKVADGYARFLVTSVGINTTWGLMMYSIGEDSSSEMPLQIRIKKLNSLIGKITLVVALLVNIISLLRFFTGHTKDENGITEFNGSKTKVDVVINGVRDTVLSAISIIFITIPEGLPLAITLVLAYSMKRMMADQALVRKLSACETIGFTTTICTDKTGTLTMNKMKVTKFCLGQKLIDESRFVSNDSYNVLEYLYQGAGLNTTGGVYKTNSGSELEFTGSPTEKAILSWAVFELKMDMEVLKRNYNILHVEAFNTVKKRSGILSKKNEDNTMHVHWKGAPDVILAMCSHYYDQLGNVNALDDSEREKFDRLVQVLGASSLRCIAFAHKEVSEHESYDGDVKLKDENLNLLGLVGMKNPCRPGVWKAVQHCQQAGVNVMMITGDNVSTAKAIATDCGILKFNQDIDSKDMYGGLVVEGWEFRNYTPEERMEKVDSICVMASSTPFDKLLMVQCLQQKGRIVAVTGDDINDAPALFQANIGLSMGIGGTEVAKESSDIVILDDNFTTVVNVLRWGKCIYNNIQKVIQFQLTVNLSALVINFVAAVSTGKVPLTAVKLVWINLIMDTLAALALATEEPTLTLVEKWPLGDKEPLISNIMLRNLIGQALYQILVLLTLQFGGMTIFNVSKKVKDTLIFHTFVLCQVFNEFNSRKLEKKNVFVGMHKKKLFLGIIGITVIFQASMIEFLVKFADTERLTWGQWGACTGLAVVSWPIGFLVKLIPVPERPFCCW